LLAVATADAAAVVIDVAGAGVGFVGSAAPPLAANARAISVGFGATRTPTARTGAGPTVGAAVEFGGESVEDSNCFELPPTAGS
jgi:hypothetical protein